jgi:hypothetical protein
MHHSSRLLTLPVLLLGVAAGHAVRSAEPIKPEEFRQLIAVIKPGPGEDKWAEIPWGISIWEARKQAAREGKPVLLWEMDGHPLGCT